MGGILQQVQQVQTLEGLVPRFVAWSIARRPVCEKEVQDEARLVMGWGEGWGGKISVDLGSRCNGPGVYSMGWGVKGVLCA